MTGQRHRVRARLTSVPRTASYFVARGPSSAQAYLRWRLRRVADRIAPRSYDVHPSDLGALLAGRLPGSVGRPGDAAIAAHFRGRTTPRFRFGEGDREEIVGIVSRADRSRTVAAATALANGRFDFRGMPSVDLASPIDWLLTPDGNLDWRWDLNRHRYFETLGRAYWYEGDERHADALRRLLVDWRAANPASTDAANWSSVFEVALRVDSWLAAFHLVRRSPSFDDAALLTIVAGLLAHGRFLAANLEHHVPNNHLLLEAKALVSLGVLMPEFPHADAWRANGRRILDEELRRQVCSDGGHAERTPLYHRMVTGELLELAVILEVNQLPMPESLSQALPAMVDFEVSMTRPDGALSLFSDSVQGDSGVRFTPATAGPAWLSGVDAGNLSDIEVVPESDAWLLGLRATATAAGARQRPTSRAFPVTGYATMRSDPDADADADDGPSLLVFDCGPFGYRPMPTHGHADALSFELYARGRLWVTDAGGYNLHLGSGWREYFRSTRAHNTVVVDGADQSLLLDGRRVYRPANAVLRRWLSEPDLDLAEADHDGYRRLDQPVIHARSIVALRDGAWLVIDALRGDGRHQLEVPFHLPPDLSVDLEAATGRARAVDVSMGAALSIVPAAMDGWSVDVVSGATDPVQGWVSVESGSREAAPVVRYRRQAVLPIRLAFLLVVGPVDAPPSRLDLTDEPQGATRLRVERGASITGITIDALGARIERAETEEEAP
jgi:uncharacterized heparinase superfamily protein